MKTLADVGVAPDYLYALALTVLVLVASDFADRVVAVMQAQSATPTLAPVEANALMAIENIKAGQLVTVDKNGLVTRWAEAAEVKVTNPRLLKEIAEKNARNIGIPEGR